jgi:hypothetical protein
MSEQLDLSLVGKARTALGNGNVLSALQHLDAFLAKYPVLQPDDIVRQAEDIERHAYGQRVADLVDQIGDAWRAGQFDGNAIMFECHIEEEASISDPREARACLFFSDNAEAADRHVGAGAFDWSCGVPWCELAHYTLLEDIREGLEQEGLLDRDPPLAGSSSARAARSGSRRPSLRTASVLLADRPRDSKGAIDEDVRRFHVSTRARR